MTVNNVSPVPVFVPAHHGEGAMFLAGYRDGAGAEIIAREPFAYGETDDPADMFVFTGLMSGKRFSARTLGEVFGEVEWYCEFNKDATPAHQYDAYKSFNMECAEAARFEAEEALRLAVTAGERVAAVEAVRAAEAAYVAAEAEMVELRGEFV